MTSVLVPFGTRPEIIKLAPVVKALAAAGFDVRTVATGQHYDPSLTDVFFGELGVDVHARWEPAAGDEGARVGAILSGAYAEVATSRPDLVLLLGDTHTVPLFALAARRHGVPIAHLEAGMRSLNPTSVEEVNRQIGAAVAGLHLPPTELAARFLAREGVPAERIVVVGNPVIDVLRQRGIARVPVDERRGVVVTAHRASNVDDDDRLWALVQLLLALADELGPVTFPVHPRTAKRLEETGLDGKLAHPALVCCDPVGYDEMLTLLASATLAVTDSGGLQEEASYFGVPAVVLRRSTPRWEGVQAGIAALTGMDADRALAAARRFASAAEQARVAAVPCPYGDGHTGERVVEVLSDGATWDRLRLVEPDFTSTLPRLP